MQVSLQTEGPLAKRLLLLDYVDLDYLSKRVAKLDLQYNLILDLSHPVF